MLELVGDFSRRKECVGAGVSGGGTRVTPETDVPEDSRRFPKIPDVPGCPCVLLCLCYLFLHCIMSSCLHVIFIFASQLK